MDYRLVYTQKALNDLGEIVAHIAEDDPGAALRFGDSLTEHIELLTRFPRMGSLIKKRSNIRKLTHSPFLVYYQMHDVEKTVEIVHIRHGARKPPSSELQVKRQG